MNNNFQHLLYSDALKKGADLWVLSNPELNSWHSKIDWYLGFQLKKNNLNKLKPTSAKIQSFCTQYRLPTVQYNNPALSPTLIASSTYLPNLWTLQVPYISQWLSHVYKIWSSLNQPRLRIFIPSSVTVKEIRSFWPNSPTPIQYVLNT